EGKEDPLVTLQKAATQWVLDYKPYLATPEGCGVRYLLAAALFQLGEKEKNIAVRDSQYFRPARDLCRDLERTDNDFVTKAQEIKISIVRAEGGFDKAVKDLKNFDDCIVRAQYEAFQMSKDGDSIKDPKQAEKKRQERLKTITTALTLGLELAKKDSKV